MLQSKTDKIEENQIAITDFDFKIVETAIKYFYGINITVLLNISDGIKLLQFADVYGISNLKVCFCFCIFNLYYCVLF